VAGSASGLKENPTRGGFSGGGAGSMTRVGKAAAGTRTANRTEAMTVASRFPTHQYHLAGS